MTENKKITWAEAALMTDSELQATYCSCEGEHTCNRCHAISIRHLDWNKKFDLVVGQCEHCGHDYRLNVRKGAPSVECPRCFSETENWDTPNAPQMAPSIVSVSR